MRRDDFRLPTPPPSDRPTDRWVCGNADLGTLCSHGPSPDGTCPITGPCQPRDLNGKFQCTRPACLGGKCGTGPTATGQCGLQPAPCIPRLSWNARRHRWTVVVAASFVAVLMVMLGLPWQQTPLRPGELHRSHAQILEGRLASQRCASCHPAAKGSLLQWFVSAGDQHAHVTQTQLCMDCHHATIPPAQATWAHHLSEQQLDAIGKQRQASGESWHDRLPAPSFASTQVQCSACHREHHGANADLTMLTNQQCQTCHSDRFASFADGHPQWTRYPHTQQYTISFDHRSHALKHYAQGGPDGTSLDFDCRQCHQIDHRGEVSRVNPFEQSCAGCHQQGLEVEIGAGLDWVSVPSLPVKPDKREQWPRSATGFYDGQITPLTRLLLASDAEATAALQGLPAADFERVDSRDPRQQLAAEEIATAIAGLLESAANEGAVVLRQRLRSQGASADTVQKVLAGLSDELLEVAYRDWFIDGGQDSLVGESVAAQNATLPASGAQSPVTGWQRDGVRLSIGYRPGGHADSVLTGLLDLVCDLPTHSKLTAEILQLPAVAACVRCHPLRTSQTETRKMPWVANRSSEKQKTFTKFSHQPHLQIPALRDCQHCHQLNTPEGELQGSRMVGLQANPSDSADQFRLLEKNSCAACHRPSAAGDQCTQCHNYHITP